jgi:hypothetical protein
MEGEPFRNGIFTGPAVRRLKTTIRDHGFVWAIGRALLAGIAVPVIVGLVLKALGLIHGASLHTWLLDTGRNVDASGFWGSLGAGAAAGAGGGDAPHDKDPDPCAGERKAVLKDQGDIDNCKGQLDSYATRIDHLANPMNAAQAKVEALAPAAQSEVAQQFAMSAITTLLQGAMQEIAGGSEAVEDVNKTIEFLSNPLSQVPGQSAVEFGSFLKEMYQYFQVSQGNLNALEELCKENPSLVEAKQFLDAMTELQNYVNEGYGLVNRMNGVQEKLQKARDQLKQDQQDLDDCEAGNSGSDSSGGDA